MKQTTKQTNIKLNKTNHNVNIFKTILIILISLTLLFGVNWIVHTAILKVTYEGTIISTTTYLLKVWNPFWIVFTILFIITIIYQLFILFYKKIQSQNKTLFIVLIFLICLFLVITIMSLIFSNENFIHNYIHVKHPAPQETAVYLMWSSIFTSISCLSLAIFFILIMTNKKVKI